MGKGRRHGHTFLLWIIEVAQFEGRPCPPRHTGYTEMLFVPLVELFLISASKKIPPIPVTRFMEKNYSTGRSTIRGGTFLTSEFDTGGTTGVAVTAGTIGRVSNLAPVRSSHLPKIIFPAVV
jgi:hypothetical protein